MIIAMWSGPRNISTALMRSFGNRSDTAVLDEPLYGRYLYRTGYDHPGREEIMASQSTGWKTVLDLLTGPIPGDRPIWYQKHMAHHLFPDDPLDWTLGMRNCLLLRHPALVIRSYGSKFRLDRPEQLGFPQQERLFEYLTLQGQAPIVLDSADILKSPAVILEILCRKIGIPFDPRMLHWEPGLRKTDGVWAKYWYESVQNSAGFQPYRKRELTVEAQYEDIFSVCMESYRKLAGYKIAP